MPRFMSRRLCASLAVCSCCVIAGEASADVLHFKDGTQIEGELLDRAHGVVWFRHKVHGLPKDGLFEEAEIERIEVEPRAPGEKADGETDEAGHDAGARVASDEAGGALPERVSEDTPEDPGSGQRARGAIVADDPAGWMFQVPPGERRHRSVNRDTVVEPVHRRPYVASFAEHMERITIFAEQYVAIIDMRTGQPVFEMDGHADDRAEGLVARIDPDGALVTSVNGRRTQRNRSTGRDEPVKVETRRDPATGKRIGNRKLRGSTEQSPPPLGAMPVSGAELRLFRDGPGAMARSGPSTGAPAEHGVRIYNTKNNEQVEVLVTQGRKRMPQELGRTARDTEVTHHHAFSPDHDRFAALLFEGSVNIWTLGTGAPPIVVSMPERRNRTQHAIRGAEQSVRWADATTIEVSIGDGSLYQIDCTSDRPRPTKVRAGVGMHTFRGWPGETTSGISEGAIALSPDAKWEIELYTLLDRPGNLAPGDPSSGGQRSTSRLLLVDFEKSRPVRSVTAPQWQKFVAPVLSPDSKYLAVGTDHGAVHVLSVESLASSPGSDLRLPDGSVGDLKIPDPIYASWEGVPVGGSIEIRRTVKQQGVTTVQILVTKIVERDPSRGITTRTYDKADGPPRVNTFDLPVNRGRFDIPSRTTRSLADKTIYRSITGNDKYKRRGAKVLGVGDRKIKCEVYEEPPRNNPALGAPRWTRYHFSEDVPGLVALYEHRTGTPDNEYVETREVIAIHR